VKCVKPWVTFDKTETHEMRRIRKKVLFLFLAEFQIDSVTVSTPIECFVGLEGAIKYTQRASMISKILEILLFEDDKALKRTHTKFIILTRFYFLSFARLLRFEFENCKKQADTLNIIKILLILNHTDYIDNTTK